MSALPSSRSSELKWNVSSAASVKDIELSVPSSSIASTVTVPWTSDRLAILAKLCCTVLDAGMNSGSVRTPAADDRLATAPDAVLSRFTTSMSTDDVTDSRHLPAPSPRLPVRSLAPSSNSSDVT